MRRSVTCPEKSSPRKVWTAYLTVTAYYQALGKALQSLLITMLRNVILFIPGVIILNSLFGLKGTIAAQPVVETILAIVCLIMYIISKRRLK